MSESAYRLPRTVVPSHYALEITPNLVAATFAGTVDIEVDLAEATDTVTLHALDLTITLAKVSQGDGQAAGQGAVTTQTAEVTDDDETETVTLRLANQLSPGTATLHLAWTGEISDGLGGL